MGAGSAPRWSSRRSYARVVKLAALKYLTLAHWVCVAEVPCRRALCGWEMRIYGVETRLLLIRLKDAWSAKGDVCAPRSGKLHEPG